MSSKGEGTIGLDLDTSNCYVCGPKNAHGLHVPFVRDGENASRGIYTARAEHCGWPGLLHGGIALALMDEALAWALYFQGLYGVTARLEIRFREAIPVGAKLVIRAWTLQQRRRIVNARAEIRRESSRDVLVAEADATMYLQEVEGHNSPAN